MSEHGVIWGGQQGMEVGQVQMVTCEVGCDDVCVCVGCE